MSLIYAHRGANRRAPENTRRAFDLSFDDAIDGIETDVQMSADGVTVLWHDDDFAKLNMPNQHLDNFTYLELSQLNFAAHFPDAPAQNVMRLDDFMQGYRSRTRLLLEIKNRPTESTAHSQNKVRQTLSLVGTRHTEGILISSFHLDSLLYAHSCASNFPLVYNLEPEQTLDEVRSSLATHSFLHGYCLHISRLNSELVTLLRQQQKLIAVYTCNSADEIQRALDLQVDILISDIPKFALQLRNHAT